MTVALPPAASAGVDPALELALADVEARLASLGDALRARDPQAIDRHAAERGGAIQA